MKEHSLVNLSDQPDDLVADFSFLHKDGRPRRRIYTPGAMPSELQRRVFEIPELHS